MPSSCGVSTSTSLRVTERKRKNEFSDDYHGITYVQREHTSDNTVGTMKRQRCSEGMQPPSTLSVTSWSHEDFKPKHSTESPTSTEWSQPIECKLPPGNHLDDEDDQVNDDAVSNISTHDWTDIQNDTANLDTQSHECDEKEAKELVGTPELWNALSSLLDDGCSDLSGMDAGGRFDQSHDTDEVDWSQMDKLMVTHEYGAWMHRMKHYWNTHLSNAPMFYAHCVVQYWQFVSFVYITITIVITENYALQN